jgi:hypothetical protein
MIYYGSRAINSEWGREKSPGQIRAENNDIWAILFLYVFLIVGFLAFGLWLLFGGFFVIGDWIFK